MGIKIRITLATSSDIFSLLHLAHHSAFSSLAEPAAMKIYCVCIRKELNSNRTSSWSPFDCFGTLTWRPWLHGERRLYLIKYVTMEARVKARQWVTWKGIKKGFASEKLCRQESKRCCTSFLTVPVLWAMWIFSYISHCLYPLIGRPTSP